MKKAAIESGGAAREAVGFRMRRAVTKAGETVRSIRGRVIDRVDTAATVGSVLFSAAKEKGVDLMTTGGRHDTDQSQSPLENKDTPRRRSGHVTLVDLAVLTGTLLAMTDSDAAKQAAADQAAAKKQAAENARIEANLEKARLVQEAREAAARAVADAERERIKQQIADRLKGN